MTDTLTFNVSLFCQGFPQVVEHLLHPECLDHRLPVTSYIGISWQRQNRKARAVLEMQRGNVPCDSRLWRTRGKGRKVMRQHNKAKQQQRKPRGSTCRAAESSLLRKHHVMECHAASPSASAGSQSHGLCLHYDMETQAWSSSVPSCAIMNM